MPRSRWPRCARDAGEVPIGAVVALDGDDRGAWFQPADSSRRSDRARRDRRAARCGAVCRQLSPDRRDALRDHRAVPDVRRRARARARRDAGLRCSGAEVGGRDIGRSRRRASGPQSPLRGSVRRAGSGVSRADAGVLPRAADLTLQPGRRARYNQGSVLTRSRHTERYRSGRNGRASKACCRVTGTWVRIPPSPPTLKRWKQNT